MKRRVARTLIPFLTALGVAVVFVLAQWQPEWLTTFLLSSEGDTGSLGGEFYGFEWYQLYFLLALGAVGVGMSIRGVASLTEKNIKSFSFWMASVIPVMLTASGLLLLVFLQSTISRGVLTVVVVFLVWLFMKLLYYYFHDRVHYQAHAIENISNYLHVIILFFLSVGFYNIFLFAQGGFWQWFGWLSIIMLIVTAFLTIQLFWVSDIILRKYWHYIVIAVLVVFQAFAVMRLLPTSVYVNGSIVALTYYMSLGLMRNAIRGSLTAIVIRRYVTITLVIITVVLATAKWF